ncbi:MAG: FIST C-terminal domain-containing protein [Christensenellaceae bacterium]|nr:FIST C-terminal domain-containing protein [Christensenellaceae bacterium]
MRTAFTEEVDDKDLAVKELLEQLDVATLSKNSVGIIFTCVDFVDSGVIDALRGALPFDYVGMTTMAEATDKTFGKYVLSVGVLTSDDCEFVTTMTPAITLATYEKDIIDTYKDAKAKLGDDPKFILSFFPYVYNVSGHNLLDTLTKVSGVPVCGSVTMGDDFTYDACGSFFNGGLDKFGMTMLLVKGNVEPKFISSAFSENKVTLTNMCGIVTKSEGCHVKTVNDIPFVKYVRECGLELTQENSTTLPLLFDLHDGANSIAVGAYKVYDDGSVMVASPIPEGSSLTFGQLSVNSINESLESGITKIKDSGNEALILMPCVSRFSMLYPQNNSEMERLTEVFGDKPFILGYSGGEVCPVKVASGEYVNRFHNYTFTAVVL